MRRANLIALTLCAVALSLTACPDGPTAGTSIATTDGTADPSPPDATAETTPSPDVAEPDVAEPDVAEPDVAEPDVAGPDVHTDPDDVTPDLPKPDVPQPDAPGPDAPAPDVPTACDPADCSDGDLCNGMEVCLEDGSCGPGGPLVCQGACLTGTCAATLGCETTPTCDDPLDWALELILYDGAPDLVYQALLSEMGEAGCVPSCGPAALEDPCFAGDAADMTGCTTPDVCGDSSIYGQVTTETIYTPTCNEFFDWKKVTLTATDFHIAHTKQKSLELGGTLNYHSFSYYSPQTSWSAEELAVGQDFNPNGGPGWALPFDVVTLNASGSFMAAAGIDAPLGSDPYRQTAGSATAPGHGWTATWSNVRWAPLTYEFDADLGQLVEVPGCTLEPSSGAMTVEYDAGTNALPVVYSITFDGDTMCDGCARVSIDEAADAELWCGLIVSF